MRTRHWVGWGWVLVWSCGVFSWGQSAPAVAKSGEFPAAQVGGAARMAVSPSLINLQASPRLKSVPRAEPHEIPLGRIPRAEAAAAKRAVAAARDPVVQAGPAPRDMPAACPVGSAPAPPGRPTRGT